MDDSEYHMSIVYENEPSKSPISKKKESQRRSLPRIHELINACLLP